MEGVKGGDSSNNPLTVIFFFLTFIYLAAPGLSCSLWDPVPQPGLKPDPCTGSKES